MVTCLERPSNLITQFRRECLDRSGLHQDCLRSRFREHSRDNANGISWPQVSAGKTYGTGVFAAAVSGTDCWYLGAFAGLKSLQRLANTLRMTVTDAPVSRSALLWRDSRFCVVGAWRPKYGREPGAHGSHPSCPIRNQHLHHSRCIYRLATWQQLCFAFWVGKLPNFCQEDFHTDKNFVLVCDSVPWFGDFPLSITHTKAVLLRNIILISQY